jgi:hypothetical protein
MLSITPATKVAELLAAYPELEPVLVAQAPAFERLRNPVLRRTVARVTSIAQAAAIAGLEPRQLVLTLRRAAGQPADAVEAPGGGPGHEACAIGHATCASAEPPPCAVPVGAATRTIDVDVLLNAGEVPLEAVFGRANSLAPGESLDVLVGFQPVPMIDRLHNHGFACALGRAADGRFVLRVTRRTGGDRAPSPS